ncbi:hypothetical protein P9239_00150 [Caballeronia sp. LZ062]|uniref:hypothetical protein n=1 Tax=unclassified Caballeronia TaxID=2646786 RepID=UPI00285F749A|nr:MULTISPECIES: hypothetical protein [unclassified Caballeronia]MDR5856647.1 hypothetical protein [Caballeronia sp. LZ050]MDR5868767.1 hypothetical protein [Caballeronia sp. LZ062]
MSQADETAVPDKERVPEATQLLTLPFVSAVAGVLDERAGDNGFRVVLHRTMCRDGVTYLQQITNYVSSDPSRSKGSGRVFPVDKGIIGAAFINRKLHRTAAFTDLKSLEEALAADLLELNRSSDFDNVARSYFAMPFLGRTDGEQFKQEAEDNDLFPLAILYAECFHDNIFSDDRLTAVLNAMCRRFASTLDKLAAVQLERVRNFPFPINDSVEMRAEDEPYRRLNGHPDENILPPVFKTLRSFNFEFVV